MNNYLKLTSVMMKNEAMQGPSTKNRKILIGILGMIAVLCIFVPACVLVGGISFIMTTAVVQAGGNAQGLGFILMFIAGFSIIFGLSVILNVFYFSNDMNYLLPFPMEPWEIIASKFTVAYINESVMEFMVILSALIGYMLATKVSLIGIILCVFGMLTIPILPLVYCGIISIIMMTFTGIVKNKDSVHKIMGIATVVLVVAAFVSVSAVGGLDIDNYAVSLKDGTNGLYNILSVIFLHVSLLCDAMSGKYLSLIIYVAVNIFAIAIFLLLAQKFYFVGVVGLTASGKSKMLSAQKVVLKHSKVLNKSASYLKKEVLMLLRTPAFLMNCVLINFLWPALLYAVYMLQGSSKLFKSLLYNYREGNEKMIVYVPVIVFVISILITSANAIASSAITREGTGYVFMKYIPMSIREQLLIKGVVSIIISQICMSLYIVASSVLLNISFGNCIFYNVISFIGIVFVTFMGITLDTVNPKLLWDDEINALRGNSTIFFGMAYAMILAAIMLGMAYLLLEFTRLKAMSINIIIVVIMTILDVVAIINCINMGESNLDE